MDEACNLRLQKLELTQEGQNKKIGALFAKQKQTDKALQDIWQIKWMLVGAIGYFVLDKLGFIKSLELIF